MVTKEMTVMSGNPATTRIKYFDEILKIILDKLEPYEIFIRLFVLPDLNAYYFLFLLILR